MKTMADARHTTRFRCWLWLIALVGVIVPRRLRADWRQEWEAELRYRELLLVAWDKLDSSHKLDLLRRSLGAFWDALLLQPRRWEDEMGQDLRFGLRMLRQHRGFTAVAVLSLALGIGANTALFSIVDSLLLRPLPYRGAERLVKVMEANLQPTHAWEGWTRMAATLADFYEWRKLNRSFEDMTALTGAGFRVTSAGVPEDVPGRRVTVNFFEFLGVEAALGRTFRPEDEQLGGAPAALLSHQYWVDRCHADPHIVGQKIVLNDQPHVVVGVLPASFREYFSHVARPNLERWAPLSVFPEERAQIWTPAVLTPEMAVYHGPGSNNAAGYMVLARRKPDVTMAQARADMAAVAARLAQTYPWNNRNIGATLYSLHEEVTGSSRRTMWLLMAAFALVLLIACANVAGLLLARGSERAQELALRAALGAGRGRLLRQLLTECALLTALGGALGLLLAGALVAGVRPLIPADIPRYDAVTLDYRALLFTLGLTLLTTLLCGLLPAWQMARINLTEELKEAGRSASAQRRQRWWRHALVVGQVALTVLLLVGAGLLTRSLVRIYRAELGFDAHNVVKLSLRPPRPYARERYPRAHPNEEDAADWQNYWQPLLARARSLPGVVGAAFTSGRPLEGVGFGAHISIPGHTAHDNNFGPVISGESVSPDYFGLMGIKLAQGRVFTAADRADAPPVIIVNESFARTYFPQQPAVGQTVLLERGFKSHEQRATIIGVVADTRARLDQRIAPHHYRPLAQMPLYGQTLVVRTAGDPAALVSALRQVAASFNPREPVAEPAMLTEVWAGYTVKPRFYLALLGGLAVLALLLAATGIYGTLRLMVSRRRHEIGVRRALGAQNRDVLALVFKQGLALALTGLAIGLLGALGLTRFIRHWLLFEVSATDPLTLAAVTVLLLLVVLLACYAPARRALRLDPLASLRHD